MRVLETSINRSRGSEEEDLLISNQSNFGEDDGRGSNSGLNYSGECQLVASLNPVDKYNGVYILFYLLGMGTLLPWNFFITANGYWMYKLRDLNETTQPNSTAYLSPLQLGFTSYLCVTSLVPSTVVLVVNAFIGHKVTFKLRIAGGLFGVVLFFTLTTILVKIDTDGWQLGFYAITLASAFIINVVSSIFQGGICGLAGKFPTEYINAVLSGQALGGIFASLANIASIALGASPIESAFLYFLAADITLLASFFLYLALSSTEFFLHYSNGTQVMLDRKINDVSGEDDVVLIGTGLSYRRIISEIWPYLLSVALVYVVTLSLFPAVAVLVQSSNRGHGYIWNDVYFSPIACFLLMNLSDFIGRTSVGKLPEPSHPRFWTIGLSVLRLAFVPLMMLCNAQPRMNLPVVFSSDAGFVAIMTLFGLTNGYLSNICFTMAPRSVTGEEQETAASLMAAGLGIGLALGGAISSVIVRIL